MAEAEQKAAAPAEVKAELEGGTYEIIRNRLNAQGAELRKRLDRLNTARKTTFGAIDPVLLSTERVATANNCVPRDMVPVGKVFLFGYNVHIGLRRDVQLDDVFAVYAMEEQGFREQDLALLGDTQFQEDFRDLYRYYKNTRFAKFYEIGPYLYMIFHVGKTVNDFKAFKWLMKDDGTIEYIGNRSDHEVRYPSPHEFEWVRSTRDMHRTGASPHVSVLDEVFVETIGGDLTIKIEDNTDSGEGIYSEPVENPDQTLDDAEIFFADVGNLVLLKIRPYQEQAWRHFVYSKKIQQVQRIDAIEDSCVLLPEGQGIIFSSGYYLQTGEYKKFSGELKDMLFERKVQSPNGEDFQYVFYNRLSGVYVLLSYNIIEQNVETPVICSGFSLFSDGKLIYFKADDEPRKTHAIQVWQTPFVDPNLAPDQQKDSHLFKIGNRDIVRCMAACHGILNLLRREDTYEGLYVDIVQQSGDVVDTYFWIDHEEAGNLKEVLLEIRAAAASAVEEFEKVVRVRRNTAEQVRAVEKKTSSVLSKVHGSRFEKIDEFVLSLSGLRTARGEIISLRELRYVDLARVDELEKNVQEETDRLSRRAVEFLLNPDALAPYHARVKEQQARIPGLEKVKQGRDLEADVGATGEELEMLIDVVSNLKIDDATQRTTIIDSISTIFATLNGVRSALKKKIRSLASTEGQAEFGSQMKLLNQAVINYLDVCDTPRKCEEYLTKVMVQVEELEGKFADFDEFTVKLAGKREEVYDAFESRKLKLVEERNRRTDALARSAERILKGIRTRINGMRTIDEINGYFAADLMIEKVRDVIERLTELGDAVKAGDVQTQLKTIREDAVRQLKDRLELFVGGEDVIAFGEHHFAVNTQALDLTTVRRDDGMFLHLTGTDFFEAVGDETFLAMKDVWDRELVSETEDVYRAEYLVFQLLQELDGTDAEVDREAFLALDEAARLAFVQRFMAPRYAEGYVKGVHDRDAAAILSAFLDLDSRVGLLRYPTPARALAITLWQQFPDQKLKALLAGKLLAYGHCRRLFPAADPEQRRYLGELEAEIASFVESTALFDAGYTQAAALYLFHVLCEGGKHPISPPAAELVKGFESRMKRETVKAHFKKAKEAVAADPAAQFLMLRDWVGSFVRDEGNALDPEYVDEAAALLVADAFDPARVHDVAVCVTIPDMAGDHAQVQDGSYTLDIGEFMMRLSAFARESVPRFESFAKLKRHFVDQARNRLRLEEFEPRVLSTFVRNQLIDRFYLPLVGDNLAKQIGVVGADTRTDRMGLLLLVSPPGYGKTTLMEYIASRLGIVFMKINGPAIGHRVTSLDPAEAPNAAARSELEKLNLALEMGDNVMLYVDDIQHCNPEFLQKFISLCDAQRRIEGVYRERTRTYDLRGKKVAVVMAGNPYTESGELFKVPDMLANRADTYNLGDIIGDNEDAFKLSYLENSVTSNPVLSRLAARSQKDILGVIRLAETGSREGIDFEASYSPEELNEFVDVMRKLMRVRDVVLTVNQEYIRSAAQADEFRTEPAFKLQGSYRNMNRMGAKILPIMNDGEVEGVIHDHYESEAQTLTTGTEANLLKLKELLGTQNETEQERWAQIKKTYERNQLLRGAGGDDRMGQIIAQMTTVTDGLTGIRDSIGSGVKSLAEAHPEPPPAVPSELKLAPETLKKFEELLKAMPPRPAPKGKGKTKVDAEADHEKEHVQHVEIVNRVPRGMVKLFEQQFALMQSWIEPLYRHSVGRTEDVENIKQRLDELQNAYRELLDKIDDSDGDIRGSDSGRVVRKR